MRIIFYVVVVVTITGLLYITFSPTTLIYTTEVEDKAILDTKIVAQMSINEKIGQLFIVGFEGTEFNKELKDLVINRKVGGIILYSKNIKDESQLEKLIYDFNNATKDTQYKIPLFIAIDQEGGDISRVQFGKYEVTAQSDIKTSDQAYSIAKKRGEQLKRLGVTMNFSPVLDYTTDRESFLYDRVFHGDPNAISLLGSSMVKGYKDAKIIAVPKHFPGHIQVSVDPHKNLPESTITEPDLIDQLMIFQRVINNSNPPIIMVGHIYYSNIDEVNPTSLSHRFIEGMLKKDLSYKGLVITDDLQMGAIIKQYSPSESAIKAIEAGNSILLYSKADKTFYEAYDSLLRAFKEKKVDNEKLNENVKAILKVKQEYLGKE